MIIRKTISIKNPLFQKIQNIRGKILQEGILNECSFTLAANIVMLAGVMAFSDSIGANQEDWNMIIEALNDDKKLENLVKRK